MKTIFIVPVFLLLLSATAGAGGTWEDITFTPPSLGFETPVRIYLPEGYDPQGAIDYPSIYWLHGWSGGHACYSVTTMYVLDSLITSGQIEPVIVVKPNGLCTPFGMSMWANSELYGNYEDYVTIDLVDYIEEHYCVCTEPWRRCMAGHSGGASGALDIALRHTDMYRAVAVHAGYPDQHTGMSVVIPIVITECPEKEPPYSYDWNNGMYTDALFLYGGAYSPDMANPPYYVDFLLDEYGDVVDSVQALWDLHNPAHMVKLLPLPLDLAIFFDTGTIDTWQGIYEASCGFSDTLTALGIDHTFQILEGVGHDMNVDRFMEEFLFLDEQMTGIEGGPMLPAAVALHQPFPNPFSSSTTIAFGLPGPGPVRLEVYDIAGRLVQTLVNGGMTGGEHSVELDGSGLASGVYLVRLSADSEKETARVVLMR